MFSLVSSLLHSFPAWCRASLSSDRDHTCLAQTTTSTEQQHRHYDYQPPPTTASASPPPKTNPVLSSLSHSSRTLLPLPLSIRPGGHSPLAASIRVSSRPVAFFVVANTASSGSALAAWFTRGFGDPGLFPAFFGPSIVFLFFCFFLCFVVGCGTRTNVVLPVSRRKNKLKLLSPSFHSTGPVATRLKRSRDYLASPVAMPLSNRRRARRKEIQLQETSDAEAPDSSPSRPSNKKRKVSAPRWRRVCLPGLLVNLAPCFAGRHANLSPTGQARIRRRGRRLVTRK